MTLRAWSLPSLIALAATAPTLAQAEEVHGTRSAALVERAHDIRLKLDRGVATLRARRTVHNGGPRHDQATFWLDIPTGGVAVGLRTKGTLHGKDHWFDGELLEAELAARRYQELTGIGGYYPKDPALLSWRDPEQLTLQVFPVAPQTDKMVEYTLLMPTFYAEGRDHLELPVLGTDAHPARVTLTSAHPRDQLFVDGSPVAHGARITLDAEHEVSLARQRAPRIAATLASVPFADDRVLMHYDVALAPTMSTIPRNARVVVVLDGSRSLRNDERESSVVAAQAYLEHIVAGSPGARAEVVVFDHEIEPRHGRLVSARSALADLQHLRLPGNNGSRVDAALARAGELLEAGPAGPRRIVLFTDARTRAGLEPARMTALAQRSGAVVHIGIISTGVAFLERVDDHAWSEAAATTEGVVWTAEASASDPHDETMAVFEELARPVRLDHFTVDVLPLDDPQTSIPEMLPEGEGLDALALVDRDIDHLRISGRLWNEPVNETVFATAEHGRQWAALVFGSELLAELTEAEMMPLAMLGGAVSPVTSYLAIEPGVRPSTEGLYEAEGLGLIGRGGGGSGMGTIGMGSMGAFHRGSRQDFLDRAVRDGLDACGGTTFGAHVALQSTLDEIVEITAVEVPDATDPVLEPCLASAVWALTLRSDFEDPWRGWTVTLPAP